jgi:hypothetical protein
MDTDVRHTLALMDHFIEMYRSLAPAWVRGGKLREKVLSIP